MFASSSTSRRRVERPALDQALRQRVTPIIPASARTLPVAPALAPLLPGGSLRRGTTTLVSGPVGSGATSLGVSLLAHASHVGHWCAAVGLEDPGVVAMAELGLDLRRVVFVPRPRAGWAEAAAELLDGVELILLQPPGRVPHAAARRLVARARERRAALVVVTATRDAWPLSPEVAVTVEHSTWQGAGTGEGRLLARRAEILVEGRGATRAERATVWLPSSRGEVTLAGQHR